MYQKLNRRRTIFTFFLLMLSILHSGTIKPTIAKKVTSFDEDAKFLNMKPLNLLLKYFQLKGFGPFYCRSRKALPESETLRIIINESTFDTAIRIWAGVGEFRSNTSKLNKKKKNVGNSWIMAAQFRLLKFLCSHVFLFWLSYAFLRSKIL